MTITCANCSREISASSKYCMYCGAAAQGNDAATGALTCPVCFSTYGSDTKYCTADGARLIRINDAVPTCPTCGNTYADDVKFCTRDGSALTIETHTSDYIFSRTSLIIDKAALGRRFAGSLLDGLLVTVMSLPAAFCLYKGLLERYMDKDDASSYFIATLVLYIPSLVYAMIKDGLANGQSIGKRAVDIMVVDLDTGRACGKGKSFVRNLITNLLVLIPYILYVMSRSPLGAFLVFVVAMIDPILVLTRDDGRKIGDLAARTQVINF